MKLLLDFPWPLISLLGPESSPATVITGFLDLRGRLQALPLGFFPDQEQAEFYSGVEGIRGKGRFGPISRLLDLMRTAPKTNCEAAPLRGPDDLRATWRSALYEELQISDWRTPQIIVPAVRAQSWPDDPLIAINCSQCGNVSASGPHERVLVIMEEYEVHSYARSDLDPWNLEHTASDPYPKRLPKPPLCDAVLPEELSAPLAGARASGCRANDRYYFIPPASWTAQAPLPRNWRKGKAFDVVPSPDRGTKRKPEYSDRKGYLDFEGRVWVWDDRHGHWDVQFGGKDQYVRVSHEGGLL